MPRRGLKPMKTTTPSRLGIIERVATVRVRSQTASTVEAVDGAPALQRDLLRRREELAARVVDEDVDPSEALERPVDERSTSSGSRTSAGTARQASPSSSWTARGAPRPPADDDLRAGADELARPARPIPVPPPVTSATLPSLASVASGERNVHSASVGLRPSSASRTGDRRPPVGLVLRRGAVPGCVRVDDQRRPLRRGAPRCRRLDGEDVERGARELARVEARRARRRSRRARRARCRRVARREACAPARPRRSSRASRA